MVSDVQKKDLMSDPEPGRLSMQDAFGQLREIGKHVTGSSYDLSAIVGWQNGSPDPVADGKLLQAR